jgi:hypothetical protein
MAGTLDETISVTHTPILSEGCFLIAEAVTPFWVAIRPQLQFLLGKSA